MKHLLLGLLILLITATAVSAQKIRFTDTANRWKIESVIGIAGESCQEIALMKMGADTTILGLVYKKPEILSYSYRCEASGAYNTSASAKITGGYYREDTSVGRVYCRSIWPGDSVEYVIYDAAWRIGDTLAWGVAGHGSGKSKVIGFDSALLNNVWHKVFRIAYLPQGGRPYEIVEGIGCTNGPAFPVHANPPFENYDWLHCFSQNGVQPPFVLASGLASRFNNTTSCAVVRLEVEEELAAHAAVSVIPNPGAGEMVLRIKPAVHAGSVQLLDISGRIIASFNFREKTVIPIGQHISTPGLYWYCLRDAETGQRYISRFIFQ